MSFSVGTGDLRIAARGIAGVLDDLEGVGHQVGNADPGVAGHPSLGGAISAFKSVWSPGLAQLHEALTTVSGNLGTSAAVYDSADDAVRAAFEQ